MKEWEATERGEEMAVMWRGESVCVCVLKTRAALTGTVAGWSEAIRMKMEGWRPSQDEGSD